MAQEQISFLDSLDYDNMDILDIEEVFRLSLQANREFHRGVEKLRYSLPNLKRVLKIIDDNNCDLAVRQAASIHLKNFVIKHWEYELDLDMKDSVSDYLFTSMMKLELPLRLQMQECLKTVVYHERHHDWPTIFSWIEENLRPPTEYEALCVLKILIGKYRFKEDAAFKKAFGQFVKKKFRCILLIFDQLLRSKNYSSDVVEMIKTVCKIFRSSLCYPLDSRTIRKWMVRLICILNNAPLEGRPSNPGSQMSWPWWKVIKCIYRILNEQYTSFGLVVHPELERNDFDWMLQDLILKCHLSLLGLICMGEYLPDEIIIYILEYLTYRISEDTVYNLLRPDLEMLVSEVIFPLLCFNENDQILWFENPQECAQRGYDIDNGLYGSRIASMKFLSALVNSHSEDTLETVLQLISSIFMSYGGDELHGKKEGAMVAVGLLHDQFEKAESCKSMTEEILAEHIFTEFSNPIVHFREKAVWVAGNYADFAFTYDYNFQRAFDGVILGLADKELPVRAQSAHAVRKFLHILRARGIDLPDPVYNAVVKEGMRLVRRMRMSMGMCVGTGTGVGMCVGKCARMGKGKGKGVCMCMVMGVGPVINKDSYFDIVINLLGEAEGSRFIEKYPFDAMKGVLRPP